MPQFGKKSAPVLHWIAWLCFFRSNSGNVGLYLSTDVITSASGHDGAEYVALTVPRDRVKPKLSEKSLNLRHFFSVYLHIIDETFAAAAQKAYTYPFEK